MRNYETTGIYTHTPRSLPTLRAINCWCFKQKIRQTSGPAGPKDHLGLPKGTPGWFPGAFWGSLEPSSAPGNLPRAPCGTRGPTGSQRRRFPDAAAHLAGTWAARIKPFLGKWIHFQKISILPFKGSGEMPLV